MPAHRKSTSQASGCRSTTKTAPSGCGPRARRLPGSSGQRRGAALRADSYDADRISAVSEYQCRQHAADYGMRPGQHADHRRSRSTEAAHARSRTSVSTTPSERSIWTAVHIHPTRPRTWSGFSTGVYDGNMLTIKTTRLKAYYLRQNGVPASDRRTMTEHLGASRRVPDRRHRHRRSGVSHRTSRAQPVWALDPGQTMGSNWCEYAAELPLGEGWCHYLPGTNPVAEKFSTWYGITYEATRGGAETMYPVLIEAAANVVDARSVRPLLSVFQRRRRMRVEIVRSPAPGSRRSRLRVRRRRSRANAGRGRAAGAGNCLDDHRGGHERHCAGRQERRGACRCSARRLVQAVMTEVRKLTDKPVRYIVNTNADPDHVGGNAALVSAVVGRDVRGAPMGSLTGLGAVLGRPAIIAHTNVLSRMSKTVPALPAASLPTTE